ncbi:MAG: hypothetical protein IK999_00705 [Ruminococcus sp.]|nr:hypothetical protein [Ruminococcus sp.]
MLNEFLEWAKNNGWNVIPTCDKTDLPDEIKRRYDIPSQWYSFICSFQICEDRSQTKWFLTPKDYYPQDKGFQWNDLELQSLEYADNDSGIIAYWDKHLPIFISVDGEYSYYAINTENGNIVVGYEPEFEVSSVVADDFYTFIGKIISGEIIL